MTKDSNVGSASIYEAGDQRTTSRKEEKQQKAENRYDEGQKNAHKSNDSKDQRTIANRLAAAESSSKKAYSEEKEPGSEDPRAAAVSHGNEPSKGAKIDAELQADDEATLAKKEGKTN